MRKTTREKTDATWETKHQLEGTQTQVDTMTKEQQKSKTALSYANNTIAKLQAELAEASARAALGKMLNGAEFVAVERVLSLLSAYSSSELLLIIKQSLSIISVSDPGVCVCMFVCVCACVRACVCILLPGYFFSIFIVHLFID